MICTCDNCHYTFAADELPTWCSNCGQENRNHKFAGKILSVPCIRPATEDEADQYEKVVAEERDVADLVEKLRMLGEPYFDRPWQHEDESDETVEDDNEEVGNEEADEDEGSIFDYPPDPYNLPVHEHNFALMLVYYIKQLGYFGRHDLEKMIMGEDIEEKVALYKNVKKIFTSGINKEERGIEKPNHVNMEVWSVATPALKTLYAFRQDDHIKILFGDVPNRGNIKRIDVQKLAEEPSEGFVRFMTELYNGLRK